MKHLRNKSSLFCVDVNRTLIGLMRIDEPKAAAELYSNQCRDLEEEQEYASLFAHDPSFFMKFKQQAGEIEASSTLGTRHSAVEYFLSFLSSTGRNSRKKMPRELLRQKAATNRTASRWPVSTLHRLARSIVAIALHRIASNTAQHNHIF